VDQVVVRAWIMLSNFFRGMGNVKLDRPAAARPEVYEERSSPRTEQVARMRARRAAVARQRPPRLIELLSLLSVLLRSSRSRPGSAGASLMR
jgi:hypothetical protein